MCGSSQVEPSHRCNIVYSNMKHFAHLSLSLMCPAKDSQPEAGYGMGFQAKSHGKVTCTIQSNISFLSSQMIPCSPKGLQLMLSHPDKPGSVEVVSLAG